MMLASLGAEVIKVEGHRRSDLTRRSVVWPLPDPRPTSVPPSQGMAFNSVNLDKRSLTLDLSQPAGVEIAKRLAAHCDAVVDNMRPGALAKLGLGYQDLRRLRDDIIVASSSGRGASGPESAYLGYAPIHHAIGGWSHLTGHRDDPPSHSGGDVDLMNAITLAFAILAALYHRDAGGGGQFIDYSQCEGVTSLIGEALLGYQMTSRIPLRDGNAHPFFAPHNVYRAWGVDRWLAIEVHSDEEFATLARLIGRPELASDSRFATAKARKENERELDLIIEEFTRERDRDHIVATLTAAGLAAAPSRDGRDLYADPHLRARDAFLSIDHPELGTLEIVAPPWRMSSSPLPARHAPLLGQDNDYVLRELLEMSDDEVENLRRLDVIL
jgi:crotonobetainyl-CoA:carnitine CoA-transferase CaiB-like acyl-CoA transferase